MNLARLSTLGARRRAALRRYEDAHELALEAALEELNGSGDGDANVSQAARLVGVTRRTIYARINNRRTNP